MFFKDDWAVSSRLTLNLGLRYDVETGTVNTDLENPVEPGEKKGDYNNFAPRLGFAYDLRGDGRTVLRGGYGRNFDKVLLNISSNERRQILFQFATTTVLNPSYTNPLNGLTFEQIKAQNLPRNMIVIANDYRTPTADQLSIGVAHQFGRELCVPDGLRPFGRLQRTARQKHQLLRGPRDAPAEGSSNLRSAEPAVRQHHALRDDGSSDYNGWQFGFQARSIGPEWMRSQVSGTYTLSWTYSDHESNRFDGVTNPFNLADEWSFSASDQRHRFILNSVSPPALGHAGGGDLLRRIAAPDQYPHQPRSVRHGGYWPLARCHRSHDRPQQRADAGERLQARSPVLEERQHRTSPAARASSRRSTSSTSRT